MAWSYAVGIKRGTMGSIAPEFYLSLSPCFLVISSNTKPPKCYAITVCSGYKHGNGATCLQ